MNAIFKKELKHFFITPIGYVYLAFFQILASFFFVRTTNELSYADMSGSFFFFILISVLLLPILTMRLISEEKKNKTDVVLFTSPVSNFEIIFEKFLAGVALFVMSMALTLVFLIILIIFGKPPLPLIFSQYIGFFMLGVSFISIGLYTSSLTENQIVSAIVSFTAFLVIFFIEWIPINNTYLMKIIDAFSLMKHYENFNIGIINFSEFFYFLTVTSVFLYLSMRSLRQTPRKFSKVFTWVVVCVLISANILISMISDKFDLKLDLSQSKIYTISKQTKDFLKKINKEIIIYEIIADGKSSKEIENFIKKYVFVNRFLNYEVINLNDNQDFLAKFPNNSKDLRSGSIIVECGDKHKIINPNSFVSEEGIQIEQKLTSAIDFVFNNNNNYIVFTKGHNENFDEYQIKEIVEYENYTCVNIDLAVEEIEEENKNILLIIDPQVDFSQSEISKIENFSKKGKNLMVFLSPFGTKLPNLMNFLKNWGIEPNDDFLIETDKKKFLMEENGTQFLLPKINYHEITSNIMNSHILFTRSKSINFFEKENVETQSLFETSQNAISKTTKNLDKSAEGAFNLALLSTKKIEKKQEQETQENQNEEFVESNLLVFGSPSILMNIGANIKFFINSINFLSKKNDSILIEAKSIAPLTIQISKSVSEYIKKFLIFLIPFLFLIIGALILKRRQRN